MGILYSDSHSANNSFLINWLTVGQISSLSSTLRGYCFILTGRAPGLNRTTIGEVFLALPGVSEAHTPRYTWF